MIKKVLIGTVALLLRHGLRLAEPASDVDEAIGAALDAGARTRDIALPGEATVGTVEMGDRIVEYVFSEALEGLA